MSNMSYCRFENTLHDLRDCQANMFEEDLSSSEEFSRKKLIELCSEIAEEHEE